MTDRQLDAVIERRRIYDADGACRACGHRGPLARAARGCRVCDGNRYLDLGADLGAALIDHAAQLRAVVADLCEDVPAVREVVRLRNALEGLASWLADERIEIERGPLLAHVRDVLKG